MDVFENVAIAYIVDFMNRSWQSLVAGAKGARGTKSSRF